MTHSPVLNRYNLGDMEVSYLCDEGGHVGLRLLPAHMASQATAGDALSELLVQLHVRGDFYAGAAANGHTLSGTVSSEGFVEVQLKAGFEGIAVVLND